MKEAATLKTFKFPVFKFGNLFFSIPAAFMMLYIFAKLLLSLETEIRGMNQILNLCILAVSLALICFVTIITFFRLNTLQSAITPTNDGFIIKRGRTEKTVQWKDVKSVSLPKDRYESLSKSSPSTLIFSFGVMKILIIKSVTWTVLNKVKRKAYNSDFQSFSEFVRVHCHNHHF